MVRKSPVTLVSVSLTFQTVPSLLLQSHAHHFAGATCVNRAVSHGVLWHLVTNQDLTMNLTRKVWLRFWRAVMLSFHALFLAMHEHSSYVSWISVCFKYQKKSSRLSNLKKGGKTQLVQTSKESDRKSTRSGCKPSSSFLYIFRK